MPDYSYIGKMLDVLGSTGTVIIPGLPTLNWNGQAVGENSAKTTFTTVKGASGVNAVFTYSKARTLFDKATQYVGRGQLPFVPLDGVDEEADTPDATYWSIGDGLADASRSWIFWFRFLSTQAGVPLGRWDFTVAAELREWFFSTADAVGNLRLALYDESANVQVSRQFDSGVPKNVPICLGVTLDVTLGSGATIADGIAMYLNGAVKASTPTNNASFVATENLTVATTLGFVIDTGAPAVLMGGEVSMMAYTQIALSAAQHARIHVIGREALQPALTVVKRRWRGM